MFNCYRKPQIFLLPLYIQHTYFDSTSTTWFPKWGQMKIAQNYKRLKDFLLLIWVISSHSSMIQETPLPGFFLKTWWHLSRRQEHQMGVGNLVSLIYCSFSSTCHKRQRWVPHTWHVPRCNGCIRWEPPNLHESIGLGVWK